MELWRICGDVVMCSVFVYMFFYPVVSYRCRKGTRNERNTHDMMTKTDTRTIRTGSYETDYEAIYETDHAITTAEADNLIASKYHMFPITRASYAIDGDTITVRYTVDSCD